MPRIPTRPDVVDSLRCIVADGRVLAERARTAEAARWSPAPTRHAEVERRASGGPVADPTARAVTDDRRLAVSDAIRRAEVALAHAARVVRAADATLADVLDAYYADPADAAA